jgi:hypothetical protein
MENNADCCVSINIFLVIKSRIRWAGNIARMVDSRGVNRVLSEKPDGKRLLRRARRRWEDNIKIDLQEVECWIRIGRGGGHL